MASRKACGSSPQKGHLGRPFILFRSPASSTIFSLSNYEIYIFLTLEVSLQPQKNSPRRQAATAPALLPPSGWNTDYTGQTQLRREIWRDFQLGPGETSNWVMLVPLALHSSTLSSCRATAGKAQLTMSLTSKCPLAKAIELGGVETGSMKA